DFAGVLEALLTVLHRVAIAQAVPEAVDNSSGDRDRILAYAAQFAAEDVQLFYQLGLHGRRDLPLAPDPRGGLEMALLRMLAFRPQGIPRPPRESLSGSAADSGGTAPWAESAPAKKPEAPVVAPVATAAAAPIAVSVPAPTSSPVSANAATVKPSLRTVTDAVAEAAAGLIEERSAEALAPAVEAEQVAAVPMPAPAANAAAPAVVEPAIAPPLLDSFDN